MPLPNKIKTPPSSISQYKFLFAGVKKVGKTAFCAQWPNHFIFEFECGNALHLAANYEDIPDLKTFDGLLKEAENDRVIKTIIWDEVNILYEMLIQDTCRKAGVLDPQELPYGRGWGMIGRRFQEYINRISSVGKGLLFTGHTEVKQHKSRSGREVSKLEVALSGRVDKIMDRITNFWGVMDFDEKKNRVLIIKGDDYTKAGHGFADHFTEVVDGTISMGNSPEEAYSNFIDAWNNIPTGKKKEKKEAQEAQDNTNNLGKRKTLTLKDL